VSRVLVVGLDGVPYSFITKRAEEGKLPRFRELLLEGSIRRMRSVIPTVSSVAWSTYMTGKNPGKHGIYGFIDRRPGTYEEYVPLSSDMKSDPLWEILSNKRKRVVVINVPVTYPPRRVNGILISGFLAIKIEKATYPREVADVLNRMGYRIDVDPWKAREGKIDEFLGDLDTTLEKRFEVAFRYMNEQSWDFFQLHVMGTDRINHFLWNSDTYSERFLGYYRKIDYYLGELKRRIDHDTTLVILSDHGFCAIEKEIDLNVWLRHNGYLSSTTAEPGRLVDIGPHSTAYSLPPGRIYAKDEKVREEIERGLTEWRDPDTGKKIVERVFKRHELYEGEMLNAGPDLVAHPYNGFDLKASFKKKDSVSTRTPIVGMHTYDDAFIYIRGKHIEKENPAIVDVMPTILGLLEVDPPDDIDGSDCV